MDVPPVDWEDDSEEDKSKSASKVDGSSKEEKSGSPGSTGKKKPSWMPKGEVLQWLVKVHLDAMGKGKGDEYEASQYVAEQLAGLVEGGRVPDASAVQNLKGTPEFFLLMLMRAGSGQKDMKRSLAAKHPKADLEKSLEYLQKEAPEAYKSWAASLWAQKWLKFHSVDGGETPKKPAVEESPAAKNKTPTSSNKSGSTSKSATPKSTPIKQNMPSDVKAACKKSHVDGLGAPGGAWKGKPVVFKGFEARGKMRYQLYVEGEAKKIPVILHWDNAKTFIDPKNAPKLVCGKVTAVIETTADAKNGFAKTYGVRDEDKIFMVKMDITWPSTDDDQ